MLGHERRSRVLAKLTNALDRIPRFMFGAQEVRLAVRLLSDLSILFVILSGSEGPKEIDTRRFIPAGQDALKC